MGVSTEIDISRVAPLGHQEAMRLAEVEYRRFAELLDDLDDRDWSIGTSCPGWAVRDVAGHVLGAMRSSASIREQRSQLAAARRHDGSITDGLTATQVERTATLSAGEVRREIRALIPAAVRGRRRTPGLVRRVVRIPVELPVSGLTETWRLGYLLDRVLTRDVWMHRNDIAAATGRLFTLTSGHDGRLIADVVADWSTRHRHDFRIQLDGEAGGTFVRGAAATTTRADAVEFGRALSGRGPEVPLGVEVPF